MTSGWRRTLSQAYPNQLKMCKFAPNKNAQTVPEHLACLMETVSPSLSTNQKQQVASLITEYSDVFISPDGSVGKTDLVGHFIGTGDSKPFKLPTWRIPIFKRAAVEEVDKMLNQNIIEEVTRLTTTLYVLSPKRREHTFLHRSTWA